MAFWRPWWRARHSSSLGPFSDIEILEWEGFVPDLSDHAYVEQLKARMQDRLNYVEGLKDAREASICCPPTPPKPSARWWTRPTACKLIEKAPEMGAFFIVHPGPLAGELLTGG